MIVFSARVCQLAYIIYHLKKFYHKFLGIKFTRGGSSHNFNREAKGLQIHNQTTWSKLNSHAFKLNSNGRK